MHDPADLIIEAARIARVIPISLIQHLQARLITKRLKDLMPTNVQFSVSDPISAMVCAALTFLSSPAGQQLCTDLRSVVVDLIHHVHRQIPVDPAAPVKAA